MEQVPDNAAPIGHAEDIEVEPSIEERRALIERLARSEQLSRSVRLRDFLLYVGKQSLKEGCPEINEQEIGHKVFGRPATYDRSQDNIVRVNATELRRRIESYFATDGAHESLILEIPRGHYKPVFHRRKPEKAQLPNPASTKLPVLAPKPTEVVGQKHSSHLVIHVAWASVCLVLLFACGFLFRQNSINQKHLHPWTEKPALAAFWGDFFRNNSQTDIVLPDDSATVIEELTNHSITLGDYISRDFVRQIPPSSISADRRADVLDIFGHNLVTYGGVVAAMKIIALDPLSSDLHLTASRFYGPDLLKRNNVILLGGKKANPWVYLFDDRLNFDLQSQLNGVAVINHHPQGNEQTLYGETISSKGPAAYCVVAFLPNPSRTRNTIIVAGTDSDATNAGAEFLTSEEDLEKLRSAFHTDRLPYFEALLKTSQLTGTSFSAEIVAYRTYPGIR